MKGVEQIASFTKHCAMFARRYVAMVAFVGILTICFSVLLIIARSEPVGKHRVSLMKSFPLESRAYWLCEKGLLLAEDHDPRLTIKSCSLVFRDWNGNIQWRVKIPAVPYNRTKVQENTTWNGRVFTVSPNGNVIGVAYITHDGITIQSWKYGVETGSSVITNTIPFHQMRLHPFDITAVDDGRLLFRQMDSSSYSTNLIVFDGGKKISHDVYKTRLRVRKGEGYRSIIAPDGKVLVGYKFLQNKSGELTNPDFEYALVEINNTNLIIKYRYHANAISPLCFSDGVVLNDEGARFLPTGQVTQDDNWNASIFNYSDHSQVTAQATLQANDNRWRVLIPLTGQTWAGKEEWNPNRISISYRGDFAVIIDEDKGIIVYSSPGEPLIRLPYESKTIHRTSNYEGNVSTEEMVIRYLKTEGVNIVDINEAYISPDGSRLIISGKRVSTSIDDKDIHNTVREYFVFSIQ